MLFRIAEGLMEVHEAICGAIDSFRETAVSVSRSIHDRPELKFQEHFAAEQLSKAAAGVGLKVEMGIAGLKTAFRAEFGRADGPTVAIFAEYDALPNGHSCGHNLIAGAALSAVAGLSSIADQLPGRIVFMGTPAEEGGGGKILLLERGALKGVDAAMMAHPMDMEWSTMPALATKHMRITFAGRASHAALAPWEGSSALAAVLQTFHAVDMARLHFRDGSRIHGIITDGGQAVNIIPERAQCEFLARGKTSKYVTEMADRVTRCAEAAALATGTRVEVKVEGGYQNMINNLSIAGRYSTHTETLGARSPQAPPDLPTGSTDMGDISHAMPAIHPIFAIARHGEGSCHEDRFVAHADSSRGYDAMIRVAKALALTAYDLLADKELMAAAKAEFAERRES
jgi:amidohydrolase